MFLFDHLSAQRTDNKFSFQMTCWQCCEYKYIFNCCSYSRKKYFKLSEIFTFVSYMYIWLFLQNMEKAIQSICGEETSFWEAMSRACQYKWKRCSKKKCCKQCGQVKLMGTMTIWPVQKHTEHHKTRSIQRRKRH